jgi:hypothetical protein
MHHEKANSCFYVILHTNPSRRTQEFQGNVMPIVVLVIGVTALRFCKVGPW